MSRKDYIKFAALLAGERAMFRADEVAMRVLDNMTRSMGDIFAQDNPNFNRQRFYTAAGMTEVNA